MTLMRRRPQLLRLGIGEDPLNKRFGHVSQRICYLIAEKKIAIFEL